MLVELAFSIPIMTLVMVVIIDVGLVVREHQVIQNAAREGARYSCLPENYLSPDNPAASIADIRQRVVNYCAGEGIVLNPANVTVSQTYPIPLTGGLTALGSEVTVDYTTQFLILGPPLLPTNSMRLVGRSVFRNLY